MGFALDFVGGRVLLVLDTRRLGPGLRLDRLALEIPSVSFPFDMGGGAAQFRHRRCRLRELAVSLEREGLEDALRAAPRLAAYGFQSLTLRCTGEDVDLEGVLTLGTRRIPFVVRLQASLEAEDRLAIILDDWIPFGYSPLPPSLLALGFLRALLGDPAVPGAGLVSFRGPATVVFDLVGLVLRRALPAHGWRLPSRRPPVAASLERSEAHWRFAVRLSETTTDAGAGRAADPAPGLAADALLVEGRLDEAAAAYREALRTAPDDRRVLVRLLEVLGSLPECFAEARLLARRALGEAPELLPALGVLARVAEESREPAEAASRYAALASLAERRGQRRVAVLATLACGRLLADPEPDQAISWYERALALDPEREEARLALARLYRRQGRFGDLVRIERQRLASATGRRERLQAHQTLADLYLQHLDDPLRARAELERAVRLDDTSVPAWEGLAEAHRRAGEGTRERLALERVIALTAAEPASDLAARARLRLAQSLAVAGAVDAALGLTAALLRDRPGDVEALDLHGQLCVQAGRLEEAASALERAVKVPDLPDARRVRLALTAARVRLERLADPAGARALVELALSLAESEEALDLAIALAEADGRQADLADLLEQRARLAADDETRAPLWARRAELLAGPLASPDEAWSAAERLLPLGGAWRMRGLRLRAALARPGTRRSPAAARRDLAEGLLDVGEAPTPEDVVLLLAYAETAGGEGPAPADARRLLRRLHAAHPDDARPLLALLPRLVASEEALERVAVLERIARLEAPGEDQDLRWAAAWVELAGRWLDEGRPAEALPLLERAVARAPEDPAGLRRLAEAELALDRPDAAEVRLRRLRELPGVTAAERAGVTRRLAELAERRGDLDEAVTRYREALVEGLGGAEAARAYQQLRDALSRADRWAEAATVCAAAAVDHGAAFDAEARIDWTFTAAEIWRRRLGQRGPARDLCHAVLAERPGHLGALNALTVLAAAESDYEEVARLLARKLELFEHTPAAASLLAELAQLCTEQLGRPRDARALYDRLLRLQPDHRGALRHVAADALAGGDRAGALRAYRRLLALGPDPAATVEAGRAEQRALHGALARLGREDPGSVDVEAELRAMLEVQPGDREALEALDALYTERGDTGRLVEVLRQRLAAATDPAEAVALGLRLADRLAAAGPGQVAAAVSVCRDVLRREPDHAGALARLARWMAAQGEGPRERRPVLERLLRLLPSADPVVPSRAALLRELGLLLHEALDEPLAAAECLEEARQLGGPDPEVDRARLALARRLGDADGLDRALEGWAASAPTGTERAAAWVELAGRRLRVQGRPDAALAALAALADLGSDAPGADVLRLQAEAQEAAGHLEAALAAWQRLADLAAAQEASALEREACEAALALAADRLHAGPLVESLARRLLLVAPGHDPALRHLQELARQRRHLEPLLACLSQRAQLPPEDREGRAQRAALHVEAARASLDAGEPDRGLGLARQALAADPESLPALRVTAEALAAAARFAEAAELLEQLGRRLRERPPGDVEDAGFLVDLHLGHAELLLARLGRPELAREALRLAAQQAGGARRIRVLSAWAEVAEAQGAWPEVVEILERLHGLRVEPRETLALARAYERLGRLEEALRVLGEGGAGADETWAAEAQRLRRDLLATAGRFGELARALEAEAAREPDAERRLRLLLEAAEHYLDRAGEPRDAERCLSTLLAARPAHLPALDRFLELLRGRAADPGTRPALEDLATRLRLEAETDADGAAEGALGPIRRAAALSRVAQAWLEVGLDPATEAIDWLVLALRWAPERIEDVRACVRRLEARPDAAGLADLLDRVSRSPGLAEEDARDLALQHARVLLDRLGDPAAALARLSAGPEVTRVRTQVAARELAARAYEALGQTAAAELEYRALAEAAESPEPFLRLALAQAERRNDGRAAVELLRTLAGRGPLAPGEPERWVAAALQAGSPADVVQAAQAALAREPEPARRRPLLVTAAEALAADDRPVEAREALAEALGIDPEDAGLQLRLAELAQAAGDMRRARVALASAHALIPEVERERRSEVSLARSALELAPGGDRALARRFARQAADETRLADRRIEALRRVAELAAAQGDVGHEEDALRGLLDLGAAIPAEVLRLATLLEARAAWTEAVTLYGHLLASGPDDLALAERQARALAASGDPARAAVVLAETAERLASRPASAAEAWVRAAQLADPAAAEDPRAREWLLRALHAQPGNAEAWSLLAAGAKAARDWTRLLAGGERRLAALSGAARREAYADLARIAEEELEDPDAAAAYRATAVAAAGDDPAFLAALVRYHVAARETDAAWDYGRRLLALDLPTEALEPALLDLVADAADAQGCLEAAVEPLQRALAQDPEVRLRRERLAGRLAMLERWEEWRQVVEEGARRLAGRDRAEALVQVARIADQVLGRPAEALPLLEEAVAADPASGEWSAELLDLARRVSPPEDLAGRLTRAFDAAQGPERAALADELATLADEALHDVMAAQRWRRAALLAAPGDVRRLRALCDVLARARQWTELTDLLAEAVETMVLDAETAAGFYALLGRTYLEKLERPEAAVAVFERARARGALTGRSGERLAELYELAGRWNALASLLDELATRGGDDERARQRLLVKRARVLADQLGRPAEAADVLLALFRESPARRRRLGAMARELLVRAQQPRRALGVLEEELPVAPEAERVALRLERARILEAGVASPAEALAEYRAVIEADPTGGAALLGAARLETLGGEGAAALAHAEAAIRTGAPALALEAHRLAGRIAEDLGRIPEAVKHLEAARALDPTDLGVIQSLARHYTSTGAWEPLTEVMGQEITLTPDPTVRARLWLRRALLFRDILDRDRDALRCLREAVAADPENLEAVTALRDYALERGEWETSLQLLAREVEAEPEPDRRSRLHLRRAEIFDQKLGQSDAAIGELQAALALVGPTDDALCERLCRLLEAEGELAQAAETLMRWAEAKQPPPAGVPLRLRAAALWARCGEDARALSAYAEVVSTSRDAMLGAAAEGLVKHATTAPLQREAAALLGGRLPLVSDAALRGTLLHALVQLLLALGEEDRARFHAETLLREDPTHRGAFQVQRRFHEQAGDHDAVADLIVARLPHASAEESLDLLHALGRLERDHRGRPEDAARVFDRLLELRPDDPAALDARADLAFGLGDFRLADTLYQRLGERGGSLGPAELAARRGRIAEALGQEGPAAEHYERAVQEQPGHVAALEALARLHLFARRDPAAVQALAALAEALPPAEAERRLAVRFQLARGLIRLGRVGEALPVLRGMLETSGDRPALWELLAEACRLSGRWDDVAEALGQLARLAPDARARARWLEEEGEVRLASLRDEEAAVRCFLRAADLDPTRVGTARRIASHYARTGQWSEMAAAWSQLVDLLEAAPGAADGEHAEARLGLALASLLGGGDSAPRAPALIRELRADDLAPERAVGLLADISRGLHATGGDPLAVRRLFDLVDSALGRGCLPRWAEAGERLLLERPGETGLRETLLRLASRLGDGARAAAHQTVLHFLGGEAATEDGPEEELASGMSPKVFGVLGPALPEAARTPLRTILAGLHPHLGRLAPSLDPTTLGPEVDELHAPDLARRLEGLKVLLQTGAVGVAFARRPRLPLEVVFSLPPVLLVDPRLQAWPPARTVFLLARALELVRSGTLLLHAEPEGRVRAILNTVARMFKVPLPRIAEPDEAVEKRLRERGFGPDLFDNQAMESLQIGFFALFREGCDVAAYRTEATAMANHVGLLAAARLGASLEALADHLEAGRTGGAVETPRRAPSVALEEEAELRDLVRFGTSTHYLALVKRRATLPRL
jgi:predicted Zn-dependent protease